MSDMGGPESFSPSEESSGVSEAAREQAAQRFAASQQAAKQQTKEEKRAKKRDDAAAQAIMQFLTDAQKTHLAVLIARLVALDCPVPFVLAVLSLINARCIEAVNDYLNERGLTLGDASDQSSLMHAHGALTDESNAALAQWVMRMEAVLQADEDKVIGALLVDDQNIDGTVLQLSSFVLQEFLTTNGKTVPFENIQTLSAGILQPLFTPAMHGRMERRLEETKEDDE